MNKKKSVSETGRIVWLDVARTIAIISITFNHAVNRSFSVYNGQREEFLQLPIFVTIIKVILYAFSRIGVPLFLMISGALLLPRNYEEKGISRFLKHNWLQLLITTEIWLVIMFWYKQMAADSVLFTEGILACLKRFVMTILFIDPITLGSMWYMPMILCLYLMVPMLSVALKKIDHRYFILPMAIVSFGEFLLPDVNGVLAATQYGEPLTTTLDAADVFSKYAVFLLLGYFITCDEILKDIKNCILIFACGLSFAVFCAFQFWIFTLDYDYVVGAGYASVFPLLVAVFLFEVLRRADIGKTVAAISTKVSRFSFGIYFVHICIMEGMVVVFNHFNWASSHIGRFLILESGAFLGSLLIIEVIGKNNWMGKNLFGIKA